MRVQGLQKLTLLDFPGKVACTIFTGGCNFRCPFCQNADLICCEQPPQWDTDEILAFLRKRRGLLDAVCISGGEPLLQPDLPDFLQQIRELGYAIKLDTNGSLPHRLQALVAAQLVDYVAMDIKNSLLHYSETAGTNLYGEAVQRSAAYLLQGPVPYEFRTTVVREFHQAEDFQAIGAWLRGADRYFLQSFVDSERVLQPGLHSYTAAELERFRQLLLPQIPAVQLRGVDLAP